MGAGNSLDRAIRVLFIVGVVLILVLGVLLITKGYWLSRLQQQETNFVIGEIEGGSSDIAVTSILPEVEGEEQDLLALEGLEELLGVKFANQEDLNEAQEIAGAHKLTAIGVLEIPKISLKLPIMEGTGKVGLRYGVGWFTTSAKPGQAGTSLIFGHRMQTKGRLFNRLGEMEAGDTVEVSDIEGNRYTYTVKERVEVEPKQLFEELYKKTGERNLALITCTPVGVGSHRLIVWCEME